ncbi:hypothetical protein J2Y45_006335 [Dyadobacter sp. BE34]|uniref:Uncharacterized protein n=1 Tax=Dyadobacter fermentans TaxID=94254 RepID=A0ABU1R6T8_9BACT|nr:hypothetical protein [Dyadobacter fermentans]MDR7046864.1 hypothetical protein [Dyadobacter sp. BE242]MDR7201178.1 hypothetical protein [Dyadobacter sp. BE34]MDR7219138.1 hypothetical protein [Dyadobacter sp. BE31]MDR7264652.1 hypothetical protein [Dyadobacter sp. BE32]
MEITFFVKKSAYKCTLTVRHLTQGLYRQQNNYYFINLISPISTSRNNSAA